MYRASLAEYASTRDRDKKLGNIFLCENISRTSEIELPIYIVDYYNRVHLLWRWWPQRTSNKSVEHYPQWHRCEGNPAVLRRKRKTIVEGDFQKK